MQFISIRNFEKFQHYKDRKPPWIKLYRDILGDDRLFELTEAERWQLIGLFILASQNDNRIPYKPAWLKKELALSKPISLQKLIDTGWVILLEQDATQITDEAAQQEEWASRYVSADIRQQIFSRDGNTCLLCKTKDNLEIDHILPVSKGGTGDKSNLQTLCRSCNRTKRTNLFGYVSAEHIATQRQIATEPSRALARDREETETETETETEGAPIGEFHNVKISETGRGKLIARFGHESAVKRIEALSAYMQSTGKKYKDHYATILNWNNRNGVNGNGQPRESYAERIERRNREITREVDQQLSGTAGDSSRDGSDKRPAGALLPSPKRHR